MVTLRVADGTNMTDANKRHNNDNQSVISARALLSPAKVVLIDEATANVDSETDVQLQQVIAKRFQKVKAKCKAPSFDYILVIGNTFIIMIVSWSKAKV